MDQQQPNNKNTQQRKLASTICSKMVNPGNIGCLYLCCIGIAGLTYLLNKQRLHDWIETVLQTHALAFTFLYLAYFSTTYLLLDHGPLSKPYQRISKSNRIIVEALLLNTLQAIGLLLLWGGDLLDGGYLLVHLILPIVILACSFVEAYQASNKH